MRRRRPAVKKALKQPLDMRDASRSATWWMIFRRDIQTLIFAPDETAKTKLGRN